LLLLSSSLLILQVQIPSLSRPFSFGFVPFLFLFSGDLSSSSFCSGWQHDEMICHVVLIICVPVFGVSIVPDGALFMLACTSLVPEIQCFVTFSIFLVKYTSVNNA
jgi:hypothetical protein